jgi:cell division protein FtsN
MQSETQRDKGYKPLMSNKQVIAVFIAGLLMMLLAFGAGLSVIKSSLSPGAAQPEMKNTKKADSTSPMAAKPAIETSPNAETSGATKYIIKFNKAYATREAAQRDRAELLSKNYMSAYIQEPTGPDTLYYVNVGPYESRDEAQKIVNELSSQGYKGMMIYTNKQN